MHARVKKLNPHANIPAAVKMNEINPKYGNTRKIHLFMYSIFLSSVTDGTCTGLDYMSNTAGVL